MKGVLLASYTMASAVTGQELRNFRFECAEKQYIAAYGKFDADRIVAVVFEKGANAGHVTGPTVVKFLCDLPETQRKVANLDKIFASASFRNLRDVVVANLPAEASVEETIDQQNFRIRQEIAELLMEFRVL